MSSRSSNKTFDGNKQTSGGDEHRNGNGTENENEDSRKGLAWMPRQFDDDKQSRAKRQAKEKERKANGTVNKMTVSQSFSLLLLLICLSSFLH